MSVPLWCLLGFAAWTMLLLLCTVGLYRWSQILLRRASIASFSPHPVEGPAWYLRATRAHANCVENLPLFGAVVLALHVRSVSGAGVDAVAIAVLAARVAHSLVHVALPQTAAVVSVRFCLFLIQFAGLAVLMGAVVRGPV